MTLYNIVRAYTYTLGTADLVIEGAVAGYLDFSVVTDGNTVSYGIREGDTTEVGRGTWTSATNTLTRTTVLASTNNGNKISLLGSAQVYITALAEDIVAGVTDHSALSNLTYALSGHTGFEPTITILDPAKGGTGVNNGAFNLTVPATGTAALGTGTLNHIAYWSGTNSLTGNALLTYALGASPNFLLQSDNAARIAGVFKAAVSQTANILEIQKSDGTLYGGFDSQGRVRSYGGAGITSNFFSGASGNATLTGIENTGIGGSCLIALTTGTANFGFGASALRVLTEGQGNLGIGNASGRFLTTGNYNVYLGSSAGKQNVTGSNNVNIGQNSGLGVSANSHSNNVFIGVSSGRGITTGGSNIFLGYFAGWKQTSLSNLLIIDNQARADAATEITNSIIYGVMAATPAAQTLNLNAMVILPKTSGMGIKVDSATPTFPWRDIIGNITNAGGANKPARTTYNGGVDQFLFAAGDESVLEFHIPHDYAPGTDIHLHVHLSHISTLVTG